MRDRLNTPVPKVLAWDSSNKNAVKAEYIIMEKAKGVQLSTKWPSMNFDQKVKTMKSIAKYQKAWADLSFSHIGSVYYTKDLKPDARAPIYIDETDSDVADTRFSIGPILGRQWSDFEKATLNCDRGPWTTSESYRRAMIERDSQAVRTLHTLPKSTIMLCGPSLYRSTPEKKLRACEAAKEALPHILPEGDWTSAYRAWHDDLHEENIFVNAEDPSDIIAIIDWQSTFVAPLFDHVIIPGFLKHDGPPVIGMERPEPPELDGLDVEEKSAALQLYDQRVLVSGIKFLLQHTVKAAWEAQMYDESDDSTALKACRNIYESGEGYCLMALAERGESVFKFSEAEMESIKEDAQKIMESIGAMNVIKKGLEDLFPERGVVRLDQYDDAKAALRNAKAQVIENFSQSDEDRQAWEEAWPFDD